MNINLSYNKYCVDGAAGFVGSHLVRELINQDKQVTGIDNLVVGSLDNIADITNSNFQFIRADVTDSVKIDEIFRDNKFDVVFHQACSKCTVCRKFPLIDLQTNAYGLLNVAQASINSGVKKFIHASTGSTTSIVPSPLNEYGYNYESREEVPLSFYGVSKLMAEKYLHVLHNYYPQFRYTILRYFHVYGTHQNSSDTGGVIPIFIRHILRNEPITIYGTGEQIRYFTTVDDIITANLIASETDELDYKIFDVVSDVKCSINELAKILGDIARIGVDIIYEDEKLGDIRKFDTNNNLIKKYGLKFNNNLEDELRKLVDWYGSKI